MKKFLATLTLFLSLTPVLASAAISIGWNASSTDNGVTSPIPVNGNYFGIKIPYFVGTSTSATSTLAAGLQALYLNITGTAATSTFSNGINLSGGCFSVRNTCISGGTSYTASWPITLTGSVFGFNGLSTSSPAVIGNIPYFSGVNTFANVATTSATISTGLSYTGTWGALVGGVSGTLTNTGVISNSCSGGVTCSGTNPSSISLTTPVTVALGGTNATAFSPNAIITSNGAGTTLQASSTITISSLISTTTATSTFQGDIAVRYLALTGTTATSTAANGFNLTSGCFSIRNTCIAGSGSGTVTSVQASTPNSTLTVGGTNPVTTSGTISFDINLANPNSWTGRQNFVNASSTSFSSYAGTFFGATATTTIDSAGNVGVGTTTSAGLAVGTQGVVSGGFYVPKATGNVGIGTTTPGHSLAIVGGNLIQVSGQHTGYFASSTAANTQNVNWNLGNSQRFILDANTNFNITSTSSNPQDGAKYLLKVCQPPGGGKTMSFPNPIALRWIGITPATTTLPTTGNSCAFLGLIYDGTYGIYNIASTTGALK